VIISYSHRFLLIHIPRTAGSSIHQALAPYAHNPQRLWVNRLLGLVGIHVNHFVPYQWKRFRGHSTARHLQAQLPREVFQGLFKFAFVRNPWDLMVSYYHYLLQTPSHHRHKRVKRLGGFAQYLLYELRDRKFEQSRFLTDRCGGLVMDYVGRFETLREDFAHVCRVLEIPFALPHANRSAHRDYRSYYNDQTIDLVAEHCRTDIELFGYSFDGACDDLARVVTPRRMAA